MAQEIAIPKLGLTMTEATIVEWRAGEGEEVAREQPILVIETEKIAYEVEAAAGGFLHISVPEKSVVPVGQIVGLIAESREEYEKVRSEVTRPPETTVKAEATPKAEVIPERKAPVEGERLKVSPLARKLAEEHRIDITKVRGTGPGGRVVREDVLRAVEGGKSQEGALAGEEAFKKVKEIVPLRGMRKAIAEHMHRSLQVSAHLTRWTEVDMTEMMKLRKGLLSQGESQGVHITYTDLFVKIIAEALKQHSILNSSLMGDEIRIWEDINVGVAVALEDDLGGLIVPVVRNADRRSLLEVHRTLSDLVEKARNRRLLPDDVADGTFTLTNQGAFLGSASDFDTPIINQPQVAILGTYGIADKPVVREGQIVIRPMMTCSLTHDHRVVDGVPAGRFISTVRQLMESPHLMAEALSLG